MDKGPVRATNIVVLYTLPEAAAVKLAATFKNKAAWFTEKALSELIASRSGVVSEMEKDQQASR